MIIRKRFSPYLTIFGVLLLYIILSGLLQFLIFPLENNSLIGYGLVVFVCALYASIVYYFNRFYFKKCGLTPPSSIPLNPSFFTNVIIGILIAVATLYPTRIVAYLNSDDLEYLYAIITLKTIVINLFAAVTEEIVFRGTLLNLFVKKNRKYLGLIISSVLFGALHMANVFAGQEIDFLIILNLILFGFLCGLIYLNFGIVGAVVFHFTNNILVRGFVKSAGGSNYILFLTLAVCIWLLLKEIKSNSIKIYEPK